MWSKYDYILPDIFDPENNFFTIAVMGNNSYWVHLSTIIASKYELTFDASLLGQLEEDTQYTIEIKLEDTTNAFTIYYINVNVLRYSTPYFEFIPDLDVKNIVYKSIAIPIGIMFNAINNELKIQAEEWNTHSLLSWINSTLDSNKTIINANVGSLENGDYWIILTAQFIWKDVVK